MSNELVTFGLVERKSAWSPILKTVGAVSVRASMRRAVGTHGVHRLRLRAYQRPMTTIVAALAQISALEVSLWRGMRAVVEDRQDNIQAVQSATLLTVRADAGIQRLLRGSAPDNFAWWLCNAALGETLVEIVVPAELTFKDAQARLGAAIDTLGSVLQVGSGDDGGLPIADATVPVVSKAALDAAAEFRRELAKDWYTEDQVGAMLGSQAGSANRLTVRFRRQGKLLGVWVPTQRAYRYPTWQFRADGTPAPELAATLKLLRENGGVIDHGRRTSGWNEVEWFMTPHVLLHGRRPADELAKHGRQVLHAAYVEFVEERGDQDW